MFTISFSTRKIVGEAHYRAIFGTNHLRADYSDHNVITSVDNVCHFVVYAYESHRSLL